MVKKCFSLFVLMALVSGGVIAQTVVDNDVSIERAISLIDRCYSLLDKPVPNDFQSIGPGDYVHSENRFTNMFLKTNNNLAVASIMMVVISEDNLSRILEPSVSYLMNNGFGELTGIDNGYFTLKRGNTYATICIQWIQGTALFIVGFSESVLTF